MTSRWLSWTPAPGISRAYPQTTPTEPAKQEPKQQSPGSVGFAGADFPAPGKFELRGNAVEFDCLGQALFLVEDDADAERAVMLFAVPRGDVWTRADIALLREAPDQETRDEIIRCKRLFRGVLKPDDGVRGISGEEWCRLYQVGRVPSPPPEPDLPSAHEAACRPTAHQERLFEFSDHRKDHTQ
jgi:hypothetical protein